MGERGKGRERGRERKKRIGRERKRHWERCTCVTFCIHLRAGSIISFLKF